jgi:hypothetical protein
MKTAYLNAFHRMGREKRSMRRWNCINFNFLRAWEAGGLHRPSPRTRSVLRFPTGFAGSSRTRANERGEGGRKGGRCRLKKDWGTSTNDIEYPPIQSSLAKTGVDVQLAVDLRCNDVMRRWKGELSHPHQIYHRHNIITFCV